MSARFSISYDKNGWFHIQCQLDGEILRGEPTSYQGVAELQVKGLTYIAVSEYHRSAIGSPFKPNVVYQIIPQLMS